MPAKPVQPPIGPEKDVLREVAGVLVIPDEAIAQLINRPPVPFDNEVERAGLAAQARGDQVGIAELAVHHGRLTGFLAHYGDGPIGL